MAFRTGVSASCRLAATLAIVLLQTGPRADESSKITFCGQLDGYYQYSFNHPPVGSPLLARAWDVKNDSFSISLAELNASLAPTREHPVGFTASLAAGKATDLVHATEPGGVNTYNNLLQLYGSVLTRGKRAITLDFGKFQAWACYDQVETTSSDNYSRSLLYALGEPFYHTGIRASAMITPRWMLNLYLVNGWNCVEDDNGGKTLGFMLMSMGGGPLQVMVNYIGGQEGSDTANPAGTFGGIGFMMPGVLNVNMVDVVATWQTTSRWKIVLNSDYADASRSGMAGGHWSGTALIARRSFGRGWAAALRGEHFEDSNGLKTGFGQNLNEITATLEYAHGDHSLTRLEVRHDHAGTPFFPTANGSSKDQDTLTLAQVFRL